MDNAQKAIMIGVGLFITIIIISVVLLITNLGTGMVDDARDSLGQMTASMQNTLKSTYDNQIVKGADVSALYTQYKNDETFKIVIKASNGTWYGREKASIAVVTGTSYYSYTKDGGSNKGTGIADIMACGTTAFTNYIPTSSSYHTYLLKDGDTIVGVYCELM